jgi:hypothetical protein
MVAKKTRLLVGILSLNRGGQSGTIGAGRHLELDVDVKRCPYIGMDMLVRSWYWATALLVLGAFQGE